MKKKFLKAMEESFEAYKLHGPRSNKKLIPLHGFIAHTIDTELKKKLKNSKFKITSLGYGEGKESKLKNAKYHSKMLDISIHSDDEIIATVSLKFISSNYKQNSNNYFENLLGETANIRRVSVGYAHLLVLPIKVPYYNKNSGNKIGEKIKTEEINSKNLQKYLNLYDDSDFPHKPDVLGIALIDINENNGNIIYADLDEFGINNKHKKIFDLDDFIKKVIALIELKS